MMGISNEIVIMNSGVLQRVAECCSMLQRVAVCCSTLQCVAEEEDGRG